MMSGTHPVTRRLLFVDIARTVALCGMIVFHAVKDMELFGVIAAGTTVTGGWAVFARCIAAGFLFLSGLSLVLAHARGFRAHAWARRVAMIAGAACLVSLATYFAFPSHYIFFGILHAIAVASLLSVPFIRAPAWFPLVCAMLVLAVNEAFGRSVFDVSAMAWTGLGTQVRPSLDFIPVVPWLAPFLFGIAFAKMVRLQEFEPRWPQWLPSRALAWPGQHSLAVYLLHQPVLIALIWMATRMTS
jgi:uncharacterized membrane protein